MTERHLSCERRRGALAVSLLAILFWTGPLFALDWNVPSGTLDYKMVSLSNISPERAKELLTKLGMGTVSRMPGTNSLLVTGEAAKLQHALAVLAIVDSPQQYEIAELARATAAGTLPSNERIAAAVGNISIGTFANPPRSEEKAKAIIDLHDGAVVAIAPIFQLQDIKLAIEIGPEVLKQRKDAMRYTQAGVAAPTLQATDLARPSAAEKTAQAVKTSVPAEKVEQPSKPTLSNEMQERLRNLQKLSAEARTQQSSTSQIGTQPVPATAPKQEPVKSTSLLAQADGQAIDANKPAELATAGAIPQKAASESQPVAEPQQAVTEPQPAAPEPQKAASESQPVPEPQNTPAPVTGDQKILQPGQVVPPEPVQASKPQEVLESKALRAGTPSTLVPSGTGALYEPAEFPNGDQVIKLTLPEKLPVIQLLDLVGKYLNMSYVYDPAKVTGEVTLKLNGNLQGSMKVKDLYLLLESVLQFKDLVMTRHKGNVVKIVPKSEVMSVDPQLVTPQLHKVEAGDAVVTRVFSLKHIDTASAENLLNQMQLSVGVTSMAESGTMIVTAYAHRMARIESLLDMVDKPGAPRKFKFKQLRYTMAQSLAEKVKALAEQLESVTVTIGVESSSGGPSAATNAQRLPGESEAAWRARLVRIKAAEAQAVAARARITPGGAPGEPKPGVYLDADERTNRILMIGVEDQLHVVEQLVETLDVEQQDLRRLEMYRIRHMDADEVARKLQELGIISKLPESSTTPGRITGQSRTTSPTGTQIPRPLTPTPEVPMVAEVTEGGVVGEPQVVVVESTNSLLVNATAEQHAEIATIIEYVDSEMDVGEIPYKIYPLENSTPAHLAEVLESLIQETVEQQNKEGKIEKTVISKEEKIKIVPDPNTYSLVVYGSKKNQEWISTLIKQLDKRRPQVLIDVTLVEVTKDDTFQYDLQLIEGIPNALNPSLQVPGLPTAPVDVLGQLKSGQTDRFADLSSQNGQFKGFYADKHIGALLTAMQKKDYGRVLAKPKLLVNDNEPGNIKTADITYIEKTSSIPVASGAAGQQTQLIQTSSDFQPYEAGIEMNITPHISEGDLLRLVVELKRSDFRPTVGVNKPPNTTTSEVKTAVTVPDGCTIILGGMVKLNQHKGGSKVPILGDIPLIGGLFKTIDNSDSGSKLYVFVKAEIIRPAATAAASMDDLQKISEVNRTAFEKHELEFQNAQDWPGVKSKPVSPAKVLDAN
jgi:general secretion pathway protein D